MMIGGCVIVHESTPLERLEHAYCLLDVACSAMSEEGVSSSFEHVLVEVSNELFNYLEFAKQDSSKGGNHVSV